MSKDNAPPPPEWSPTPKPWDAERCCPLDCTGVCGEVIGDNITLSSE